MVEQAASREGEDVTLLPNRPHTDRVVETARQWATQEPAVAAVVVYGSVHDRRVHAHSDVDLVVVVRPGQRDRIWSERHAVAALLLGEPPAWSHELGWQGPYRYQAWTPSLISVDLTFDEGELEDHAVLAEGFTVLHGTVADPDAGNGETPSASTGEELQGETWVWLLGLHGRLLQERYWEVFSGLIQLLDTRIRPLLPPGEFSALGRLIPANLRSSDLLNALRSTAQTFDERTRASSQRPPMVLAAAIRQAIDTTELPG